LRRIVSGIVFPLVLGAAGCSTGETTFTSTGTLRPQVLDLTLSSQISTEPSNQFMKWTVVKAEADVPGVGTVSFLTQPQCEQVQQMFSVNGPAAATCRFQLTGLALESGTTGTATVRLEVKDVWLVRGERPVLDPAGDYDDDTVSNEDDNCPYVDNTEQENENADAEGENPVGDACTNANGAKDSDADGVGDVNDNCVYAANADQKVTSTTDGFVDTVGDVCRQRIEVTLPGSTLVIQRTDQAFTIRDGGTTTLLFDFNSKAWCGPEHATACSIQPDDVLLKIQ
jgi:hypothetical protein